MGIIMVGIVIITGMWNPHNHDICKTHLILIINKETIQLSQGCGTHIKFIYIKDPSNIESHSRIPIESINIKKI